MHVLARRTGIDEVELAGLLGALVEAGCIERADGAAGNTSTGSEPPVDGLFSRIRARLARV